MSFASVGFAQSSEGEICLSIPDMQKVVRDLGECGFDRRELIILREQSALKDQRIIAFEKELDLVKREVELKDRIITVKDMEIAAQKRAFEDMKEVTDRAIKLAETAKPQSNWQFMGILGAVIFIGGMILGGL